MNREQYDDMIEIHRTTELALKAQQEVNSAQDKINDVIAKELCDLAGRLDAIESRLQEMERRHDLEDTLEMEASER